MNFLASVANRPKTSHMFAQENVLKIMCEKVIIPNMKLREVDIESFEMDCEEYMKRDIEVT